MGSTKWFQDARFGLFIHWGLYTIPAKGEWYASIQKISTKNYEKYLTQFNPIDFDPVSWAQDAKAAGMKYAVLTA